MTASSSQETGPYAYRLFGLNLSSDILLPELGFFPFPPESEDVRIVLGAVPESLEVPEFSRALFSIQNRTLLLNVPDCARYLVREGREIVCEPLVAEPGPDLLVYLYGTCLAALCYQRGMMPFHAGVVETPSGAVLVAGDSGAGKSTLAAALQERGYTVWSDDLCVLDIETRRVSPGIPRIKLWENSIAHVGWQDRPNEPVLLRRNKFQFRVPPARQDWLDLKAIFTIDADHRYQVKLVPLSGIKAIRAIEANLFRNAIVHGIKANTTYFAHCCTLAQSVPVLHVERPRLLEAMPQVLDSIEAAILS
ncbi:hypothetical protein [Niveibacterium terrae]|uniref:hypothetical protein n=1 Tax=Niveibacterium terrae TaxID=3373598 RepID=UPI003A8DD414